jgi:DcuC family C4-dicarboxylate transporter
MPLLSFWALAQFRGKHKPVPGALDAEAESKPAVGSVDSSINPVKAVVPVLPLVLLFTDSSLGAFSPLRALEGPAKILAAMLIGIFLAGLTSPRVGGQLATAFFEGAGYAYTHVISLIVAASTFAEGIDRSGLIAVIVQGLVGRPMAALAVSAIAPWALAVVSGTAIAPAVSIMEFFVPAAASMHLDPVHLGMVAALGSHFGRTMSPAAPVVAMSSKLSHVPPSSLIRLVALPLAIGGATLLVAMLLGLL